MTQITEAMIPSRFQVIRRIELAAPPLGVFSITPLPSSFGTLAMLLAMRLRHVFGFVSVSPHCFN
jgi:hypothetical protein